MTMNKRWYSNFISGLVDGCNIIPAIVLLYGSSTIRNYFIRCTILNGFIFLGSIYFYHAVLIPLIHYVLHERLSVPRQRSSSASLASLIEWFSGIVYYLFWVYPIYSISFVLSSRWFQVIAKRAFEVVVGTRSSMLSTRNASTGSAKRRTYQRFLQSISTEIFRTLLFFNHMVITSVVFIISPAVAFIMGTFLTSFYAFEYFWMNSGMRLEESIGLLQWHYWYFFGFGIPASAIVFVFPQIIGSGVFALLFPLLILMAAVSLKKHPSLTTTPMTRAPTGSSPFSTSLTSQGLPVLLPAVYLNDIVCKFVMKKWEKIK